MLNSHMRCYVTQWSVTSLVTWVCAATLSPRKFGSPVKIALWPFLFSKLLDVSAVFWSFRCIFKSKILCKQSHPIKSKGQNIKCRCYHVGNFSTMASALYRENSTCISSQEVKLQVKLPVEKKNILRLWTGFVPFFEQKLQGLFKDFQGHISHFSRTPFSAKKRFESMSFLVLPQHEQFYPEGLSY